MLDTGEGTSNIWKDLLHGMQELKATRLPQLRLIKFLDPRGPEEFSLPLDEESKATCESVGIEVKIAHDRRKDFRVCTGMRCGDSEERVQKIF